MKSFGNRGGSPDNQPGNPLGRQPGRQPGNPNNPNNQPPRNPQPGQPGVPPGYQPREQYPANNLNENYQQDNPYQPAPSRNHEAQGYGQQNQQYQQGQQQFQQNQYQQGNDDYEEKPVRIEPGKRAGALLIDFVAAYFIGVLIQIPVTFIPFIQAFFSAQLLMPVVLLFKDAFFKGRGLGKNLMGLQVVDARSGRPCTAMQSFKRNIILVAPYVALLVFQFALNLTSYINVPFDWWLHTKKFLGDSVLSIINLVGMIYVAVVLPMECYRVWRRPDSLRKGDEMAGTMVIESSMDFSNPIPRV